MDIDLPDVHVLLMPGSFGSQDLDGGWGIFITSTLGSRLEVGWISPPILGKHRVNISILPDYQPYLPDYDIGDRSGEFASREESINAARQFLLSLRKPNRVE